MIHINPLFFFLIFNFCIYIQHNSINCPSIPAQKLMKFPLFSIPLTNFPNSLVISHILWHWNFLNLYVNWLPLIWYVFWFVNSRSIGNEPSPKQFFFLLFLLQWRLTSCAVRRFPTISCNFCPRQHRRHHHRHRFPWRRRGVSWWKPVVVGCWIRMRRRMRSLTRRRNIRLRNCWFLGGNS